MPALKNQRQERFCQLVKQGIPPIRAYPEAGYNAHESAPYRLCGNVRVKRRLNEITRGLAMKTRVTVESITSDLDRVTAGAEAALQYGAAKGAIETKAKLHGLLVDRKEQGAPGDFAGMKSESEVLDLVRRELGDETATALAAALAKQQDDEPASPEMDATRDEGSALN